MMNREERASYMEKKFSFYDKLTAKEKEEIEEYSSVVHFAKNTPVHSSDGQCLGMLLLVKGELRVYMLSEDGREITLYRLFSGDACVLSASCVLEAVAFEVMIHAEEETEAILIPLSVFHHLQEENIYVEAFSYRTATERFSEVMWTMQQILFFRADQRLAIFLWDDMMKNKRQSLPYTHEQIARYIGSAREVVTRMLRYFSQEGVVALSRGRIEILDKEKLKTYL